MKHLKPFFYKTAFLIFLTGIFYFTSYAQWYNPDKVNKKAGNIYAQAYEEATDGKYNEAIVHLNEALKADPKFVDVYLSRAGIYANLKNYTASVADFETALSMDKMYASTYLLPYSISLAGLGEFVKALQAVDSFLSNPTLNKQSINAGNYRKKTYEFAIDFAKKHPSAGYIFAPKNMGDSINSTALEYFPSLTIDGSKMIFTRRINNDEDFYESDYTNGHWSKARPVGGKINTNLNEGAQNISQDGNWLIFTGCNYPEGQGSCDLYIAYKTKAGGWTEPENLGPIVNTDFWESSPSLSPDKRDLYFASDRPGGYGGKDIWVTHRSITGKWSRPENAGPTINTKGDEGCPFIHADNETLYFNSNGHEGYGMTDLFVARKQADGSWSEPENLGYPINTIDDEGSLIVSSDGKTSYYASDGADTRGGLDLYSFTLRDDIRAQKTLWVKGKVYDKKTNAGLPSTVELTDISTRKTVSTLQTDEEGQYLVTLPVGKDYAFNVNRKGYLFYSDNFSMQGNLPDSAMVVNIPLQPIEKGASIVLKNIFFDVNKFNLKPESLTELDKVIQLLTDHPKLSIQISGFTDNVGKPSDNMLLSIQRAKAVTNYFQSKGIDSKRLSAKGFGEQKPIADNQTETGRAMNRRTELSILSD
ncbi:MAG: OmpA family protein [Bacteroidetes bacterium]|nr:OmpA family protein [Bacteroidota bacterium]MBS1756148.1 OmpA family protein [Bacteroidota bacterium]